jgi:hypothetical protein
MLVTLVWKSMQHDAPAVARTGRPSRSQMIIAARLVAWGQPPDVIERMAHELKREDVVMFGSTRVTH